MSHIPTRKCCACGRLGEKPTFIRVGRLSDGSFVVGDGCMSGRGAYICRKSECIERAAKRSSLNKSFRQTLPMGVYGELKDKL